MLGSIIAGAAGGLGQSMSQMGQMGIEEKREQRLMALREKYQTRREEAAAQRQDAQRAEDREFAVEDAATAHERARELQGMREQGLLNRAMARGSSNEGLSRTDITTLITQLTRERDELADTLPVTMSDEEVRQALSGYDEKIAGLRRQIPGWPSDSTPDNSGSGIDWSRFDD